MNLRVVGLLTIAATLVLSAVVPAQPMPLGTTFTYQGQIKQNGTPYNGNCDLSFTLWTSDIGGSTVGSPVNVSSVPVANGLFTVHLDMGNVFNGQRRWLAIQAACPAGSSPTLLTPRQELTAAPHAAYALQAGNAATATNAVTATNATNATTAANFSGNLSGDVTGTQATTSVVRLQGRILASTAPISGQVLKWNGTQWAPGTDSDSTASWLLTGNAGTTAGTQFFGTTDSQALEFKVNNSRALRLEPNATSPNIIGGHSGNIVDAGVYGATISGGGSAGAGHGEGINHVYGKYGTISGGARNNAGGDNNNAGKNYATVGGGYINTARGESSTIGGGWQNAAIGLMATVAGGGYNFAEGAGSFIGGGGVIVGTNSVTTAGNQARGNGSTIPGGANNYISTNGTYAAIGGGESNTANGYAAMVGGGTGNSSGDWASVPGGRDNFANGAYSFAAGRRAKAGAAGSFVWSDSNDSDTWSFNPNEFVARATGGFYFYTGINPTSGARLQAGSGTWSDLSDKNSKTDFTPVDSQEVLTRLSRIPLSTWRYKSQADGIRHMGPMAQDVYAAFGLGEDERYISTIDADGVALAAIQGLHQELKDRDAKIATLESRLTELEQVVKQLAAGQKER